MMMISLRVPLPLSHTLSLATFSFTSTFAFPSFTFSHPLSVSLSLALSVKSNGSLITEWRHYTRIRTRRWCVCGVWLNLCATHRAYAACALNELDALKISRLLMSCLCSARPSRPSRACFGNKFSMLSEFA